MLVFAMLHALEQIGIEVVATLVAAMLLGCAAVVRRLLSLNKKPSKAYSIDVCFVKTEIKKLQTLTN